MDWPKMGAIGSLLGGVFGALTFFIVVWPLPQIRAKRANDESVPIPKVTGIQKLISIPLIISLLLSTLAIYGAWHRNPCPAQYIATVGSLPPNRVFITVDTSDLLSYQQTHRLMLIARPSDDSIDAKEDTDIARSATFGITGHFVQMETCMKESQISRQIQKGGGALEFYLLIVAKDTEPKQIKSMAYAEEKGAKVLDSKAFVPGFEAETPGAPVEGQNPCQN